MEEDFGAGYHRSGEQEAPCCPVAYLAGRSTRIAVEGARGDGHGGWAVGGVIVVRAGPNGSAWNGLGRCRYRSARQGGE